MRHENRMKALFTSFPASDYAASKRFYERAIGLRLLREFDGEPHRFTNYDLGGMMLKVYEWQEKYYGVGHSGLFVETDDLDEVVNRIRSLGGKTTDIVVQPYHADLLNDAASNSELTWLECGHGGCIGDIQVFWDDLEPRIRNMISD